MELKIEMEDLSSVRKRLTVEIPEEETRKVYEEVSKKFASMARIPGFRPGKAPMGLIRNRFRNEIREEMIQDLLPRSYEEALKARDLKPLALPQIEKVNFEVGRPLNFQAVLEIEPQFDLGEYRGLRLEKKLGPVTDADVDAVLERLRDEAAKYVPVERAARSGDQLSLEIDGVTIDAASGEPSPEKPLHEENVSLTLGAEDTLPEFSEGLAGAAAGDTREITVTYPEDFARREMAGKSLRYRAQVKMVREKVLAELDDEFAKDLGQDVESLEALRQRIRRELEANREHEVSNSLEEQAITQLLERHRFDVPEVLVEDRQQRRLQEFAYGLARRGVNLSRGMVNWKKLKDDMREPSDRDVRAALVLDRIAVAEKLAVTDDEVDDELEKIAQAQGTPVEKVALEFEKENRMEELKGRLQRRKTLRWVLDQADVSEVKA